MISIVICSIDPRKFALVTANYKAVLGDAEHEIIGIHDARSLSEGYNRGYAQSRGEILIFCHDDIEILTPDFYPTLVRHLQSYDVVGCAGTTSMIHSKWALAGGPYIHGAVAYPYSDVWPAERFNLAVWGGTRPIVVEGIQGMDGLFIAARRTVLETVRFDEENFDGFHVYDTDFTYAAHLAGFRLAVCKDLLIAHKSGGNYEDGAYAKFGERFMQKYQGRLSRQEREKALMAVAKNVDRSQILGMFDTSRDPVKQLPPGASPPLTMEQALQLALHHQQHGRLAEAEAIYQQILRVQPRHADTWHLLGQLMAHGGNHQAAAKLIIQAIRLNEQAANYRVSLGNALQALQKGEQALVLYRQAQQMHPDYPEAYYNAALLLQNEGRLEEASAEYAAALRCKPDLVEAHCNLGSIRHAQGRLDEAAACYCQALLCRPEFALAHFNLGTVLERQGRPAAAAESYRQATRLQADHAEAHANLAAMLLALHQSDEALASYREAVRCAPATAAYHLRMGALLQTRGNMPEAIACYREAVRLAPDDLEAHSQLLFGLLYSPDYSPAETLAEHRAFARRFEVPLQARLAPHRNQPEPERRLRIGYNSYNFCDHAVGWFLEPLLANHDHRAFDIYCYANCNTQDRMQQRMRGHADHWRCLEGLSDEAAAELIRQDEIDILLDLSGHSGGNRIMIFAHKPAPVQATWLGYLHSSGLTGMDWRICDARTDPPGMTEACHSERLVRLPDSQWCYSARPDCPAPSPLPALTNGYLTFGALHNFAKVTPQALSLWARILTRLPTARLVMLAVAPGATAQQIRDGFAAHGIAPERLSLLPALPLNEYLALYRTVDVGLDTFPYNGGTTTCDALWMGVPLVSFAGDRSIARGGASLLSNLGLSEFIASSEQEYVEIAAGLMQRLDYLDDLRSALRGRMQDSALMDGKRFANAMEAAYRTMWRDWCDGDGNRAAAGSPLNGVAAPDLR